MRSADFAVFFRPHYCRLAIASLHNVSKLLKKSYYATLRTNQAKCIRFWIFAPIFWFGILLLFFTHCDLARGLMQTWQPIVQWIFIYFNNFFYVHLDFYHKWLENEQNERSESFATFQCKLCFDNFSDIQFPRPRVWIRKQSDLNLLFHKFKSRCLRKFASLTLIEVWVVIPSF